MMSQILSTFFFFVPPWLDILRSKSSNIIASNPTGWRGFNLPSDAGDFALRTLARMRAAFCFGVRDLVPFCGLLRRTGGEEWLARSEDAQPNSFMPDEETWSTTSFRFFALLISFLPALLAPLTVEWAFFPSKMGFQFAKIFRIEKKPNNLKAGRS
jgi:hypothetical protein